MLKKLFLLLFCFYLNECWFVCEEVVTTCEDGLCNTQFILHGYNMCINEDSHEVYIEEP